MFCGATVGIVSELCASGNKSKSESKVQGQGEKVMTEQRGKL